MTSHASGGPGDDFRLPDVGEGLDSAEIVEWLVAEGDTVDRDQPLVEILTDKSQTQLPSPKAGVIKRLGFVEGDMAEVGQILVEFVAGPGAIAEAAAGSDPARAPRGAEKSHSPTRPPSNDGRARTKASPVVRRRALEAGLDLSQVLGTGPGGRVTVGDLDAVIAGSVQPTGSAPAAGTARATGATRISGSPSSALGQASPGRHPLRGIRRVTAASMTAALAIPHIHGADEFDASALLSGRRRIKDLHPERAVRLTPLAFFVMAVADGLRRYPMVNASIEVDATGAGHVDVHQDVNIGIAVATDAGLVVPVIRAADQQSLFDLADEIHRLGTASRERTISTSDLKDGTASITNYGSLGGRFSSPMIRPPEAVIVGFGSIRERPIVVDGRVVARPTLPISIAVDHRLIDGDLMTAFQEHIIGMLSDPVALLAR